MGEDKLKVFVNKVGAISHNQPGNISSSGFFGASASQDIMIQTLKRNVIDFAKEYSSTAPNKARLKDFSNQIEGSLHGLRAMSTLDDSRLDELLSELRALMK